MQTMDERQLSPDTWDVIAGELARYAGKPIASSDVRFARERSSTSQCIVYVELDRADLGDWGKDVNGDRAHFVFFLALREGTWMISGYSGPSSCARPSQPRARAYLGGGYGTDGLQAAGFVDGAGCEIARAELRYDDDRTVEDVPQRGVVLFVTDEPVTAPVSVTLFDAEGVEQATHPVLPG